MKVRLQIEEFLWRCSHGIDEILHEKIHGVEVLSAKVGGHYAELRFGYWLPNQNNDRATIQGLENAQENA